MVEKQTVINRRIFFDDTGKELDFDEIRVDDLKDNGVVHVNTSGSDRPRFSEPTVIIPHQTRSMNLFMMREEHMDFKAMDGNS